MTEQDAPNIGMRLALLHEVLQVAREACSIASAHFTPICDWRKDSEVIALLDNAVAKIDQITKGEPQ